MFERVVLLGLLLVAPVLAWAQDQKPATRIYSCTAPDGRRLTSDRPIPECVTREQRLHRSDGSVKGQLAPFMTPEEAAAAELRQRELLAKQAAAADATRFDRNLLARYPRQDKHDLARQAALDDLIKATQNSEQRIAALATERKAMEDEAQFYKGKTLPIKLKRQMDGNAAARDAQLLALGNQAAERDRVNRRYDIELQRLRKLWTGALPGSLGPAPSSKDWDVVPVSGAAAAPAPKPITPPGAASKAR